MKRRDFITLVGGDTATRFDAAHSAAFPSVIISVRTKTPM